jgi:hypothetical protein
MQGLCLIVIQGYTPWHEQSLETLMAEPMA